MGFLFNCGHRSDEADKHSSRGRVCPVCHRGSVQALELFCLDCGSFIKFGGSNARTKYCKKCWTARQRENQRRFLRGETTSPKAKREDIHLKVRTKRKRDCIHYSECLMTAGINNDVLKCTGCRRYKRQGLNIMDYVKCESPLARAAEKFPVYNDLGRGAEKLGANALNLALAKI